MPASADSLTVNEIFFRPLQSLAESSPHHRPCPQLPDELWLLLGVDRVLSSARSGRAFLQEFVPARSQALNRSTYFLAQHNARRQALARDVNLRLIGGAGLTDRLGHIPELAGYDCFALDAHWHRAASHDPQEGASKPSVGHLYSLNLHSHLMRHLTVGEGVHEHDLSMLKRVKPVGLRQEVPKGRRVLLVYDRAGIDYAFWKRCRQECAVYFLTRTKEGMKFDWIRQREWDRQDPRNAAVSEDWQVVSPEGHTLRVIRYTEPLLGKFYEFLTNEMDLPPGVLAELYRRRWEIEKSFDGLKNQLEETKAWGSGLEIRAVQGQFCALTHNLLVMYEAHLERTHGVRNVAEDRRREKRLEDMKSVAEAAGRGISTLLLAARRATQRSIKFLRWLRQALVENLAESIAVVRLHVLYAHS